MDKERALYNKFLDKLNELLDNPDVSDKELRIILNFLENNNISADPDTNSDLQKLALKFTEELPYDTDEFPLERLNDYN